jgi:phenylacetyl-CoA:acceptor oxidoreductase subunit 1
MIADLNRCVGCQTCTSACKHANATPPSVQWRKVLDVEAGEFPDVQRAFVPVGCMHCEDPPCMHVCPSTATRQRPDGIVTIDYDICIGCAYCAVACPYQARFKIDKPLTAYGTPGMKHEAAREDPARLGVAQKCTFCVDRIDFGLENGLTPGLHVEATPACVNSCIADALHFGDLDDPDSNISRLLEENKSFRMHEELGTGPGFFYLWDKVDEDGQAIDAPIDLVAQTMNDRPDATDDGICQPGVAPWLQGHWDMRAAGNFMGGGAGAGLFLFTALAATLSGGSLLLHGLVALGLVGAGLSLVWLEIGRPWRFLNVFRQPQRSWMTREAMVAAPFALIGLAALALGSSGWGLVAAIVGLVFLYCQARILEQSKGIPAWRIHEIVPLIVATGLVEGGGLFVLLGGAAKWGGMAVLVLIGVRFLTWRAYRGALGREGAPAGTFAAFDKIALPFELGGHVLPAALIVLALLIPPVTTLFVVLGGLFAFAGGWLFKLVLVTEAAYNQGFALERMPARGAGASGPGIKPGWRQA